MGLEPPLGVDTPPPLGGDTPLGVSLRVFTENFNCDGKTYPEHGQRHPLG